jgi:hypothetical protein
MTSPRIEASTAAVIRRLSMETMRNDARAEVRDAAHRTGGLPVYADLGGVLVLTGDGEILRFDPETDRVTLVDGEGWRALAFARASRLSSELSHLKPTRPVEAMNCPQCGGAGSVFDGVECGKCFGLGWLQEPMV